MRENEFSEQGEISSMCVSQNTQGRGGSLQKLQLQIAE